MIIGAVGQRDGEEHGDGIGGEALPIEGGVRAIAGAARTGGTVWRFTSTYRIQGARTPKPISAG